MSMAGFGLGGGGGFEGMDVDFVTAMGHKIQGFSTQQLQDIINAVDSDVNNFSSNIWLGSDANNFANEWTTVRTSITTLQSALTSLGQRALDNAADQSQATSTY